MGGFTPAGAPYVKTDEWRLDFSGAPPAKVNATTSHAVQSRASALDLLPHVCRFGTFGSTVGTLFSTVQSVS